jgi:hypothetical protein
VALNAAKKGLDPAASIIEVKGAHYGEMAMGGGAIEGRGYAGEDKWPII